MQKTQIRFDPVENWLDMVAYVHSGSLNTRENYSRSFERFLTFVKLSANDIQAEYSHSRDRDFKRKYAKLIRTWIASLSKEGLEDSSIKVMVAAVQSYFKYNDLPLGKVPVARDRVVYHNRDIAKEEVLAIMKASLPRDRAFYAVMAQSGLRPYTLCKLRVKHLKEYSEAPHKIIVPEEIAKGKFGSYFTFIGAEAHRHLKAYWNTRRALTAESYVFTKMGTEEKLTPKAISAQFNKTIRKLRETGVLDFDLKKGKPAELRLYSLRKYFMKYARQAGSEYVEFWLGHHGGVEQHYISRDPEHHRKLYFEKAMPFLRIEKATPTETEKLIAEQAEEIERMKRKLAEYEGVDKELADLKTLTKKLLKRVDAIEKQAK